MRKTYRLLGIPIWTIEVILDPADLSEEGEDDTGEPGETVIISSLVSTPTDPKPLFGFVHDRDFYE